MFRGWGNDVIYTIAHNGRGVPIQIIGLMWGCRHNCTIPKAFKATFWEFVLFAGERFIVKNVTREPGGLHGPWLHVTLEQQKQPVDLFRMPPVSKRSCPSSSLPSSWPSQAPTISISPEVLAEALQWKTKGVQACYEVALKNSPIAPQLAARNVTVGGAARAFPALAHMHSVVSEAFGEALLFWSEFDECVAPHALHAPALPRSVLDHCSRRCGFEDKYSGPDRVPLSVSAAAAWSMIQRFKASMPACTNETCSARVFFVSRFPLKFTFTQNGGHFVLVLLSF